MKIRIAEDNSAALTAALKKVQAWCTARTLDAGELLDAAQLAEQRLEKAGLPKAYRRDAEAAVHGGFVPNSYGYTAEGTHARLLRGGQHWFLVAVRRDYAPSSAGGRGDRLRVTADPVDERAALTSVLRASGVRLAPAAAPQREARRPRELGSVLAATVGLV